MNLRSKDTEVRCVADISWIETMESPYVPIIRALEKKTDRLLSTSRSRTIRSCLTPCLPPLLAFITTYARDLAGLYDKTR